MKASDLFVKALEAEGVEYIFQSSGGNIKKLFESTEHAEILISRMGGK